MTSEPIGFVSLAEFVNDVMEYAEHEWIFRGQADINWALRPKAGRDEYWLSRNNEDLKQFDEWRRSAVAYSDRLPESDLECMAFAQHYGLATRLLDWTTNPLVALYFAAETHLNSDGAVYCYKPELFLSGDGKATNFEKAHPVFAYFPRPFDRRILAQGGAFTYHHEPSKSLTTEPGDLHCFRVMSAIKHDLRLQLSRLNVSRKSLFPELDGLSAFVNWRTEREVELRNARPE